MAADDLSQLESEEVTNWRILKHLIFHIGEDFDGVFHSDHVDFKMCFGLCHTERGSFWLASIIFVMDFIDIVIFTTTGMIYMVPVFVFAVIFTIFLLYGVACRNHWFILPFLIFSVFCIIMGFICIVITLFAVFYWDTNIFFHWVMSLFSMTDTGTRLMLLFFDLTISITLFFFMWTTWSVYIHYCYLKGLRRTEKNPINA